MKRTVSLFVLLLLVVFGTFLIGARMKITPVMIPSDETPSAESTDSQMMKDAVPDPGTDQADPTESGVAVSGILPEAVSNSGSDEVQDQADILVVDAEPDSAPTPEPSPEPTPSYDLNFTVAGQQISEDISAIDLTQASPDEIDRLISVLPALRFLSSMELGQATAESPRISWDQVRALKEGAPQAELHYSFSVQGFLFSLSDEILNLNHIVFTDEGALAAQIAACMPNLRLLDMDSCGVSNKAMAAIRDQLPNAEVAWRVWIGTGYSARTDATRLVISNPDRGGDLDTPESIEGLYYCTKVKYLDLGHNFMMSDISFVENMPDLEVLIMAMTAVSDITPLRNCPKLDYLEYQTSAASDLSVLAELTNLRDLNICHNFAVRDIRPLYNLDLDRLYIGLYTPVPRDQIEEFKSLHPNCIVNTTTEDPTEENWRYGDISGQGLWETAPRYALLREQMNYDNFPGCYAYIGNDYREYGRFSY